MCGIAGYIGKAVVNIDKIKKTLDLMKNRGPDNSNYIYINDSVLNIAFLHSRLSIIDLDARANQPFVIDDYILIFNGEIYNYIELRNELKKQGVCFKTESDTEVLLQSYILYGEKCVKKLEGMWAFAIYNQKKHTLFLSRDRFGEKPLYLFKARDGIYFASEAKFIRALSSEKFEINHKQIIRYLKYGYKSLYKNGETFFLNMRELPFANNLIIDANLDTKQYRYWIPRFTPKEMSLDNAVDGFRYYLLESVKLRIRADVGIAFCLSGGVDSAAIVSIAAKCFNYEIASFSIIDKDERYNEYDNIRATLDNVKCKHTIIDIPRNGAFERLKKLIEYHDSPVYTISYYIHSLLSEAIAKSGYRVVCSGTGADELVTGYYDHFNMYLYEMRDNPNYSKYLEEWKNNIECFVRNPYLKNSELYFQNPLFREHIYLNSNIFDSYISDEFNEKFTETEFCSSLLRNRMMNEMFYEVMPVILHEDDLNSMFYSIENRSPYLDSKLFEFSYSVPTKWLIHNGYGKYILREAVKGILNEKVRTDRQKKGFNASINSIIDFKNDDSRAQILDNSAVFDIVKKDEIERLIDKDEAFTNSYSKFLFNFINAKIFLDANS